MPWNNPVQFSANQNFNTVGMLNQNDFENDSFHFFHRDKQEYLDKIEELQGKKALEMLGTHASFPESCRVTQ